MPFQIFNEAAFWAIFPNGGTVSWDLDAGRQNVALDPGDAVSGGNSPYRVNGGKIIVNERPTLPKVTYSICSGNQINCNFVQGDPLLVTLDAPSKAAPDSAPLVLKFENPVSAVGCYLGVVTGGGNVGAVITSSMFVLLDGADTWIPFSQNGHCGPPVTSSTPGAPFLGMRTQVGKIKSVSFDAASGTPFGQICVGNLLWAP